MRIALAQCESDRRRPLRQSPTRGGGCRQGKRCGARGRGGAAGDGADGYPPLDCPSSDGSCATSARARAARSASHRVAIVLGAGAAVCVSRPGAVQNGRCCWRKGAARRCRRRPCSEPTTSSTRSATSCRPERSEATRLAGRIVGLTVCEDTWNEVMGYRRDPVGDLAAAGAALVFNPSCSPWHVGKAAERRAMLASLAQKHRVPIVFVNQVGGNDELIFDGGSFVADAQGRVHGALPLFDSAFGVSTCLPQQRAPSRRAAGPRRGRAARGRSRARHPRLLRKQGLPPARGGGLSGARRLGR